MLKLSAPSTKIVNQKQQRRNCQNSFHYQRLKGCKGGGPHHILVQFTYVAPAKTR